MEKNKNLIILGDQIREIRKAKGLSQEQLAWDAGVGRAYMGGIERGERNVTVLTLVKIAEQLGCEVSVFTQNLPIGKERIKNPKTR
ncbi:MAG: helix-turn-helix domain-containing protein [Tannerellaceae bacterium]|nr:helix-turn-helix domain-containing protein [Tannerellaceae bacterium]